MYKTYISIFFLRIFNLKDPNRLKKIISLLLVLLFFASCKPTSTIVTSKKETEKESNSRNDRNSNRLAKEVINTASKNLGVRYKAGGTTTDGFDCSGLVYVTFKKYDIALPRASYDMAKVGKQIKENEIQKGDLIFFKTNGKSVINHVGLVVEVSGDEIKFIHSSTQKGVIISSTKEPYYGKTFAQANRIL